MTNIRSACTRPLAAALLLGSFACGPGEQPGGAGRIDVSISGEDQARDGIPFDPAPRDGEPVFVDGWSVTFERWLMVVGAPRLSEPGPDPAQQRLVGAPVAAREGSWVADLTRPSTTAPAGAAGQGDIDGAYLFSFDRRMDGGALDSKTRYAFSFDVTPATAATQKVNLDAAGEAALGQMVQQGLAVWVEGTATRADDAMMPFDSYPTKVTFQLAWGRQTGQINCSNPDNGNDPEKNRGVQPRQDGAQRAVITIHTEHLFWDKLNVEAPNLRFDPIAARARKTGTEGAVTLDDLAGAMVVKLTGSDGRDVTDRGSLPGYTRRDGALSYDPNGTPGVATLKDFIVYSARSMAHLNGEGLCYVDRR
jgi:hypothetical protein